MYYWTLIGWQAPLLSGLAIYGAPLKNTYQHGWTHHQRVQSPNKTNGLLPNSNYILWSSWFGSKRWTEKEHDPPRVEPGMAGAISSTFGRYMQLSCVFVPVHCLWFPGQPRWTLAGRSKYCHASLAELGEMPKCGVVNKLGQGVDRGAEINGMHQQLHWITVIFERKKTVLLSNLFSHDVPASRCVYFGHTTMC